MGVCFGRRVNIKSFFNSDSSITYFEPKRRKQKKTAEAAFSVFF